MVLQREFLSCFLGDSLDHFPLHPTLRRGGRMSRSLALLGVRTAGGATVLVLVLLLLVLVAGSCAHSLFDLRTYARSARHACRNLWSSRPQTKSPNPRDTICTDWYTWPKIYPIFRTGAYPRLRRLWWRHNRVSTCRSYACGRGICPPCASLCPCACGNTS